MYLATAPSLSDFTKPFTGACGLEERLQVLDVATVDSAGLVDEWKALASRASEPNPFFEQWFASSSLEQFASGNDCKIATYWRGQSLVGLLPLVHSNDYYGHPLPHVSTWLHDNAFCGAPLVAKGCENGFWRALLRHLDAEPGPAMLLHLPGLPEHGPLNQALTSVLEETSRATSIVEREERAMLASDMSAEEYLAEAMSAKKRKELRRQRNRLAELGELTFERLEGTQGVEPWIEQFLTLEASGWKGDAGSALKADETTYAFFADTLCGAANAERLERLALRLNGKPIAMLANFLTLPGAYSFKTAFDEDYARFSPGLLLQLENLSLLNRPGVDWTDSCAVQGHSMIERIWREKRSFVSRNIAIGGPLRRFTARALMAYETRGRS
ncbi:GNAT family N-acetyltransferase [uncultured Erythrobacter sp.]|uniref:GNAT family N-acetyltransferase n=1 Tax=uncultured Erythrobacter sp. TaxID=263913 RepID=UPI002629BCAE|nr:GNAT family N-acetyltransferase [uncultured Erythrobacter sp.]